MTQFNQELITKARKGEIAIKKDGTGDQLYKIIGQVASKEIIHFSIHDEYVYLSQIGEGWQGLRICNMPYHSVKEFFMPDTKIDFGKPLEGKEAEILNKAHSRLRSEVPTRLDQPRTYRVTRQQMKEIYDSMPDPNSKGVIIVMLNEVFTDWENEAKITDSEINEIIRWLGAPTELLKSTFPEYFFIPEGEPVLVRRNDCEVWRVYISDGAGGVYIDSYIKAGSCTWKYIIPFTKNPPK